MAPAAKQTPKNISVRFKGFRRDLRHVWESYCFMSDYVPLLARQVIDGNLPTWKLERLGSGNYEQRSGNETQGICAHITSKALPRRTLIDSIALFEGFCGYLAAAVYSDYPARLLGKQDDSSPSQDEKLLRVIVDSSTREEILERVADEKIRGIFYGNPTDFFLKDKARLDLGSYFSSETPDLIARLHEVTGRRNLVIHSNGRVDRKYVRENPKTTLKLGEIAPLERTYLRDSILLLEDLAAVLAHVVCQNVYKDVPPSGVLKHSWDYFWVRRKATTTTAR